MLVNSVKKLRKFDKLWEINGDGDRFVVRTYVAKKRYRDGAVYVIRTQTLSRIDKDNTESNIVMTKENDSTVVQTVDYKYLLQNATALYPTKQEAIMNLRRSIHIALKNQEVTPKYMFHFTRTLSVVDYSLRHDYQTA